jgi:hypothetical protein
VTEFGLIMAWLFEIAAFYLFLSNNSPKFAFAMLTNNKAIPILLKYPKISSFSLHTSSKDDDSALET